MRQIGGITTGWLALQVEQIHVYNGQTKGCGKQSNTKGNVHISKAWVVPECERIVFPPKNNSANPTGEDYPVEKPRHESDM